MLRVSSGSCAHLHSNGPTGGRHALPPITHILARKGFLLHMIRILQRFDLVRTEKNEMDDVRRNLHINPSNRTEAGSSLTRSTLYFKADLFSKRSSLHENLWHLHKPIFHVLSTRYLTGLATAYSVGVQDTSSVCAQFVLSLYDLLMTIYCKLCPLTRLLSYTMYIGWI